MLFVWLVEKNGYVYYVCMYVCMYSWFVCFEEDGWGLEFGFIDGFMC